MDESDSNTEKYNIVLAGKFGVGKTAIFNIIKTGGISSSSEQQSTTAASERSRSCNTELEYQLYRTTLEGIKYQISIWDTGGLEKFRSMTSSYYRNTMAIILVYDSRPERMDTLFNLEEWIREAKERSVFRESMILSLWANMCDDHRTDLIEQPEVIAFKQEHNILDCLHFKVSSKTNTNIITSLHSLIEHIHRCKGHSDTESVDAATDRSSSRNNTCFKC